jgi:hypothetical protein
LATPTLPSRSLDELVYRNAFGKYRRGLMRRGNAFALARFCSLSAMM